MPRRRAWKRCLGCVLRCPKRQVTKAVNTKDYVDPPTLRRELGLSHRTSGSSQPCLRCPPCFLTRRRRIEARAIAGRHLCGLPDMAG
jgi:hypothetical protein